MSARTIRRTFAMPVVITLASSCTPMRTSNPPPPMTRSPNAPGGTPDTKAVEPSAATRRWSISHKTGGQPNECIAQVVIECPRNAKCNPPRPQDYTCPDGLGTDGQLTIVLRAGATECMVDYGDMSCPQGATCNPPPPRKLPCP